MQLLPTTTTTTTNTNKEAKGNIFSIFFSSTFATYLFYAIFFFSVIYVAIFKATHNASSGDTSNSCCNTLLTSGYWQSFSQRAQWQPLGCAMKTYSLELLSDCSVDRRSFAVIGDSIARNLWDGIGSFTDLMEDPKHSTAHWTNQNQRLFSFYWDPFFNSTSLDKLLQAGRQNILIISIGPWFMKYYQSAEEGLAAYSDTVDRILQLPTDDRLRIYIAPVSPFIEDNLSTERITLSNSLAQKYNNILGTALAAKQGTPGLFYVSILQDLFKTSVLGASDGLHYDRSAYSAAGNLIVNHVCNKELFSGKNPLKATCCTDYSPISWKQVLIMLVFNYMGPVSWLYSAMNCKTTLPGLEKYFLQRDRAKQVSVFAVGLYSMFMADRTHLFLKQEKFFNPIVFVVLLLVSLIVGLVTLDKSKDSQFLNRNMTDEWKGWMQIFILIYHYTGASSVSPIYNFARILVASYLFMTGYGHFIFFYKRKDFGYMRIVKVLVRLNLLALALTFVMEFPYQAYYFSPLVSLWFCVIYGVMICMSSHNDRTWFILLKIGILSLLMWLLSLSYPMFETVVSILAPASGTQVDIKELHFRIFLDMFIVIVGMLTGLVYVKWEQQISDAIEKYGRLSFWFLLAASSTGLMWYFVFESSENKFSYNKYHPYISFIPVIAYVVLRNLTSDMRKTSSAFYTFFGKISLETFVAQFHIWLAMDTKGLLTVIPQLPIVNFFITSYLFLYLSVVLASVTNDLTEYLAELAKQKKSIWILFGIIIVLFNHLPQ